VENQTQYTRCPHCKTAFKVSDKMMAMAKGKVRCGACLAVFQATDHLLAAKSSKSESAVAMPSNTDSFNTDANLENDSAQEVEIKPEQALDSEQALSLDSEQDLIELDTIDEDYQVEQSAILEDTPTELIEPTFSEPVEDDVEGEIAETETELELELELDLNSQSMTGDYLEQPEIDEPEIDEPEILEDQILEQSEAFDQPEVDLAEPETDSDIAQANLQQDDSLADSELLFDEADIDDFALDNLEHEVSLTDTDGFEASESQLEQMQVRPLFDNQDHEIDDLADINQPELSETELNATEKAEVQEIETEKTENTETNETEEAEQPDPFESDFIHDGLDHELATAKPSELDLLIDEQQDFEALADTLAEQINDTDTTPDPLDEFEERVVDKKTTLRTLVISSIVLIILLILSVKFWQNRQTLSWDSTWGGPTKTVCSILPCDLQPRRDVDKIKLRQKIVSPSETKEDSLDIKLLLTNDAEFDQPYPRITIKFSNSKGEVVSTQQYAVSDYFPDQQDKMMPAGTEVHIHFAADFPHPDALGFEFIFD
jgi:predicted Zn finger-like uncharacterized protein